MPQEKTGYEPLIKQQVVVVLSNRDRLIGELREVFPSVLKVFVHESIGGIPYKDETVLINRDNVMLVSKR